MIDTGCGCGCGMWDVGYKTKASFLLSVYLSTAQELYVHHSFIIGYVPTISIDSKETGQNDGMNRLILNPTTGFATHPRCGIAFRFVEHF